MDIKRFNRKAFSTDEATQVLVCLEPWEPHLASEVSVELRDPSGKKSSDEAARPDDSGIVALSLARGSDLEASLKAGRLEIQAVHRDGRLLRRKRLEATDGSPVGVKLRIAPKGTESWPIVRPAVIRRLAEQAARLQGVTAAEATAPRAVLTAIAELNAAGQLANRALGGQRSAEDALRRRLGADAIYHPGGAPRGNIEVTAASLVAMGNALGEGLSAFGCKPSIGQAVNVLKAGYLMDAREGNRDARWTRQARAYVSDRRRTTETYIGSTARAYGDPRGPEEGWAGGEVPGVPGGESGLGGPILPPDLPPTDPAGPNVGDFEPDFCERVGDLCMSLYESAAMASLAGENEYLTLLESVEPNCLCYDYAPDQEFVARPAQGRSFPDPRPEDLRLYFRNQDITGSITSYREDAISFVMPPHLYNTSGIVSLVDLSVVPNVGAGLDGATLERLCGLSIPDLPNTAPQAPSREAFISVVFPPVFDSITANVIAEEDSWSVQPCVSPMKICWRAHLLDRSVASPLPPCGSIDVVIRDAAGGVLVRSDAPSGCVRVDLSEERAYTAEATSYAGETPCGSAAPVTLSVRPVHRIRLLRDSPSAAHGEVRGGEQGSFFVELSCPPAEDLEIWLQSNRPQLLQVPAAVTVPAGESRALVTFTTSSPQLCQSATVTASAAHHLGGELSYHVYKQPVLRWRYSPPVVRAHWGFSLTVSTECLPDDPSRVVWRVVHTDLAGQARELPVTDRPRIGEPFDQYEIVLRDEDAVGLSLGTCRLTAEVADRGVVSNWLDFTVGLCVVGITLDEITVAEGQSGEDMDLSVTATADGISVKWPAGRQSQTLGEGQTARPGLTFKTLELRMGETRTLDVSAEVTDYDDFLRLEDDHGSGSGQLVVECGESRKTLSISIIADVIQSSGDGNISVDLDTGEVTGEGSGSIGTGSAPDGRVDVVFKGALLGATGPV